MQMLQNPWFKIPIIVLGLAVGLAVVVLPFGSTLYFTMMAFTRANFLWLLNWLQNNWFQVAVIAFGLHVSFSLWIIGGFLFRIDERIEDGITLMLGHLKRIENELEKGNVPWNRAPQ